MLCCAYVLSRYGHHAATRYITCVYSCCTCNMHIHVVMYKTVYVSMAAACTYACGHVQCRYDALARTCVGHNQVAARNEGNNRSSTRVIPSMSSQVWVTAGIGPPAVKPGKTSLQGQVWRE